MGLLGEPFCITCGGPPPLGASRRCADCIRGHTSEPVRLPQTIQLNRCRSCDNVLIDGRWLDLSDEATYEQSLQHEVEVASEAELLSWTLASEPRDARNIRLHVDAVVQIEGVELPATAETLLRTSWQVCGTCSRQHGRYFEATVQLRSAGRELSKDEWSEVRRTLEEMLAEMEPDPLHFVTEEAVVRGGLDVVLGSKALARQWVRHLSERWGGTTKETSSIVGRRDGVDVSRLTVAWRKPGFDIGDVIAWRHDLWRVRGWLGDGALLQATDRFERVGASWRDLESSTVAAQQADLVELAIEREDDWVVEVRDPREWKPQALKRPYDHESGPSVRVGFINDEWMALPRLPGERHLGAEDDDADDA